MGHITRCVRIHQAVVRLLRYFCIHCLNWAVRVAWCVFLCKEVDIANQNVMGRYCKPEYNGEGAYAGTGGLMPATAISNTNSAQWTLVT